MKINIDKKAFTIAEMEDGTIRNFIDDNAWIDKAVIKECFDELFGFCEVINYGKLIATKDHYAPAIAIEDAIVKTSSSVFLVGYMNLTDAFDASYSASVIEYTSSSPYIKSK